MRRWFHFILAANFLILASVLKAEKSPPHLYTWDDLDVAVSARFDALTNHVSGVFPPGAFEVGITAGYFTFEPKGDLAAVTNLLSHEIWLGIPVWTFRVVETQCAERVWLYTGGGIDAFRTNSVPRTFAPRPWAHDVYGFPPGWLTQEELEKWYAARERSRLKLEFALVSSNDWPLLVTAWRNINSQAATSRSCSPMFLSDTNQVAFIGMEGVGGDSRRLWVYTPTNPVPLDVFFAESLTSSRWSLVGGIEAESEFGTWRTPAMRPKSAFFKVARGDVDSDGDGIADGREKIAFGTDMSLIDGDNDGVSDRAEVFRYGTDPSNSDGDGDGIGDGWEIKHELNPTDGSDGEADADDDGLTNRQEFEALTDPCNEDTDADGIRDGEDKAPLNPGPLITLFSPSENQLLTNSLVTVSGMITYTGELYEVRVDGVSVTAYAHENGAYVFTNQMFLDDGAHEIVVRVAAVGSPPLESRKNVGVRVDALPPEIVILNPADSVSLEGANVRVSVWSESVDDEVMVNGVGTTKDGHVRYAWLTMTSVGTNLIEATAVDHLNRTDTASVKVVCSDLTATDPNDSDNDGVPNTEDPDPYDPVVRSTVVIRSPLNGTSIRTR